MRVDARGVHRAGVEALRDLHDAHAGRVVTREDRPLDRRRTPPARQQREVHVHEPERHRSEERLGEDLSERDHHAHFGAARVDLVGYLTGPLGRAHRQPELERGRLHRARIRGAAPTATAIGLRDHERDVVARRAERAQGGNCVVRCAEEDDAHEALSVRRRSGAVLG